MDDEHEASCMPETIAASHGVAVDKAFGAVSPPIYLSSTYAFEGYGEPRSYDYGRFGNPTRELFAESLAKLEGGAGAVITSSGMAAVDLLLAQLRPDDLVIAPFDCYGGTYRLLKARAERGQFAVDFIDQADDAALSAALESWPALVIIESPSNPLMRVVDIADIAAKARAVGAQVAVDNTFLSPALQKPLQLGADYVIHSTTKFLNGHSDVIGGALVASDPNNVALLRSWANTVGITGAPFDAWMTLRGLRTLFVRIERQQRTAAIIAEYLEAHPAVRMVHYPGLISHPDHALAHRQQQGCGAMLSFELDNGIGAVREFLGKLKVFTLAESLGGVESLIAHPSTMTHADMEEEARRFAGITDGLLRLSVGLEHEQDLVDDLTRGLSAVGSAHTTDLG